MPEKASPGVAWKVAGVRTEASLHREGAAWAFQRATAAKATAQAVPAAATTFQRGRTTDQRPSNPPCDTRSLRGDSEPVRLRGDLEGHPQIGEDSRAGWFCVRRLLQQFQGFHSSGLLRSGRGKGGILASDGGSSSVEAAPCGPLGDAENNCTSAGVRCSHATKSRTSRSSAGSDSRASRSAGHADTASRRSSTSAHGSSAG